MSHSSCGHKGWETPNLCPSSPNAALYKCSLTVLTNGSQCVVPITYRDTNKILNRVPEITVAFWIIKILSTTVGETGADYLAVSAGLGTTITDGLMAGILGIVLMAQLRLQRYVPWVYWLTVVLISVVGTQITDALTDKLKISLYVSTSVFALLLAVVFVSWYFCERTFSIHTIFTRRREMFYWTTILFTFSLGTAAGDFAVEEIGLGFGEAGIAFGSLIVAVAVAYFVGANATFTFWFAYILTRPFGAALGDALSQSPNYGGLGLGSAITSSVFLAVIAGLVAFLTLDQGPSTFRKDVDTSRHL
jgi:uncharacterized membrane-anchored protein